MIIKHPLDYDFNEIGVRFGSFDRRETFFDVNKVLDPVLQYRFVGAGKLSDTQQDLVQSITAGPALKILTSEIIPARIETLVRQREQWARDAARAFGKGDAAKASALYAEKDLIRECVGAKETMRVAVDDYLEAKQATPERMHLPIAKSNKTVFVVRQYETDQAFLEGKLWFIRVRV